MGVTVWVAFGGPERNILFVTATAIFLDLFTGKPIEMVANGSSLYKITGLGVSGTKSTSLRMPTQKWT